MVTSRSMALGTDSHSHPTKTPGHLKGRGENAILGGISIHGKTTRPTRPLGDKTPFPNRVAGRQFHTPVPHAKFPVLTFLDTQSLLEANNTPDSALRPSSARKHVRPPKSGGKSFQTPAINGKHWEIGETSFVEPEAQVQETVLQDDYDEIEYMPPNTADLFYQPPFDFEMPNYKEVGKALQKLAYSHPFDDTPPVEISIDEDEVTPAIWNMLTLPEVEDDDPFQPARAAVSNPSKGSSLNHRAVSGRYQGDVPTRPALTRTASTTHKPPSATSTKPTPSRPRTAAASTYIPTSTSTTTKSTIPPKITRSRQTTTAPRKPLSSVTAAPLSQKAASSGVPSRPRTGTVKLPTTTTTTTTTTTSTIPPRPSTSAAVRTRVTSTGVMGTKTAASLKRPSTSASSYKTTTMVTKKAGRGAGGVGRGGDVRGKRVPLGAMNARTSADDMVLEVHAAEIEMDEFRFDV